MLFLFLKELKKRWIEFLLASLVIGLVVSIGVVQRSLATDSEKVIHDYAHKLGNNMLVVPADIRLPDFYMFNYGSETLPQDYLLRLRSSNVSRNIRLSQSWLLAKPLEHTQSYSNSPSPSQGSTVMYTGDDRLSITPVGQKNKEMFQSFVENYERRLHDASL